jgi:hypothetical protein
MAICTTCEGRGVMIPDNDICRACKGAGTNGVDLSRDLGRELSIRREVSPPPCCARVAHGVWCTKPSGHAGEHGNADAEPIYGPIEAKPPIWRRHRGRS